MASGGRRLWHRTCKTSPGQCFFFFGRENKSGRESHFWPFFGFFHGHSWLFTPTFYRLFDFFHAQFFFSRALFEIFWFFSRVGNLMFYGRKPDFYVSARENFEKIAFFENFHAQKMLFTPTFLSFFRNFHVCLFFFTGKMGKYHKIFTGAFWFFKPKKKHWLT